MAIPCDRLAEGVILTFVPTAPETVSSFLPGARELTPPMSMHLHRRRPAPAWNGVRRAALLLSMAWSMVPCAHAQKLLLPEREWSDATGMFKVTAGLVGIEGDTLTLRQTDGSDLTIEIGQLARADQFIAKRTRRRLTLRGTDGPPTVEAFDARARATNHHDFPPAATALEADPADPGLTLVDAEVAIPREDHFDRIGRVIPAGGGTVVVAVENATPGRPLPTRLVWVSLGKKSIVANHKLASADIVLDYHPLLERLLTVSREKFTAEGAANQKLTLWDVAPSRRGATAWISWKAPCGDGQPLARQPWGRIVDDTLVLHQSSREEYACWDIDSKRAAYRLAQYPGHSPLPALSGSGRLLALPDTRRVQVCDTQSGKVLLSLPVGDTSGVAFDPAGIRLALVQQGNVQIHDLAAPTGPILLFRAPGSNPHQTALAWVGGEQLLVQSARGLAAVLHGVLPDAERMGLPVWRYEWQPARSGDALDDLSMRVVQGRLLYAVPADDAPEDHGAGVVEEAGGTLATIVAASLPGAGVARAADKLPAALPGLVEPGTAVATRVAPGPEHDRNIATLAKVFERTKWIYDANSPAIIEAGLNGQGTVTYKDAEGRDRQLKQVTPTTRHLRCVVHGVTLLEAKLSTDIPDGLVLEAGQTEQDLASRLQAPGSDWLDRLLLPARMIDITEADGLGTSRCGAEGLQPKPSK